MKTLRTYTGKQLLLRIFVEGFIWGLGFLAAWALIGLLFNIWEDPTALQTFLGTGRTS